MTSTVTAKGGVPGLHTGPVYEPVCNVTCMMSTVIAKGGVPELHTGPMYEPVCNVTCCMTSTVIAKGGVPELHTGPVYEPVCVYKMLQVIKYGGAFKVSSPSFVHVLMSYTFKWSVVNLRPF